MHNCSSKIYGYYLKFGVLTLLKMIIVVFLVPVLCSLVGGYQYF